MEERLAARDRAVEAGQGGRAGGAEEQWLADDPDELGAGAAWGNEWGDGDGGDRDGWRVGKWAREAT